MPRTDDPREIREKIAQVKEDLARAEGEEQALQNEVDTTMTKLRGLLDCKAGQEKAAIKKLRTSIANDETKLGELLDAIEEARDDEGE